MWVNFEQIVLKYELLDLFINKSIYIQTHNPLVVTDLALWRTQKISHKDRRLILLAPHRWEHRHHRPRKNS